MCSALASCNTHTQSFFKTLLILDKNCQQFDFVILPDIRHCYRLQ